MELRLPSWFPYFGGSRKTDLETTEEAFEANPPDTSNDVPDGAQPELFGLKLEDIDGVGPSKAQNLQDAGMYDGVDIYHASDEELLDISGIGESVLDSIREDVGSS